MYNSRETEFSFKYRTKTLKFSTVSISKYGHKQFPYQEAWLAIRGAPVSELLSQGTLFCESRENVTILNGVP